MAAPEIWGPRLWRFLHGLADLSDRQDIYPLWNSFIKYTAVVIPCQKCQKHMSEYWRQHRFLPTGWEFLRGEQVRTEIREKIHTFHNAVNLRLGKDCLPMEPLSPSLDRGKVVSELQTIFDSLREEWGGAHIEWKRIGALLLTLVKMGSNI